MKVFNFKNYTIVCESWETSHAWGHKATILWHGYSTRATAKIRYYNRTWERYQYESVILDAIQQMIDNRKTEIVDNYKTKNDIKRIKQDQKDKLYAEDELLSEYYELLNHFEKEVE